MFLFSTYLTKYHRLARAQRVYHLLTVEKPCSSLCQRPAVTGWVGSRQSDRQTVPPPAPSRLALVNTLTQMPAARGPELIKIRYDTVKEVR